MQVRNKYIIVAAIALVLFLTTATASKAETYIRRFEVGEGGKPYLKAIPDTNGYWQIGFGSTWNYRLNRWVQPGDTITEAESLQWLRNEIAEKAALIKRVVRVPINDNQFAALVSLAYNIGSSAFSGSTLLSLLNAGYPKQTVANQFDVWNKAGGVVLPGLVARRQQEKQLFLS